MYDVDAFFARQLIVGQKRVRSLIYVNYYTETGINHQTFEPEILIIDGNQFPDHVVWPVPRTVAGIEATIMVRLGMLPHKASVIFYRDDVVSTKVLESMRQAEYDSTPYHLCID